MIVQETPLRMVATHSTVSSTAGSTPNSTVDYRLYGENFPVTIKASSTNSSCIFVDGATTATTNAYPLYPGNELTLTCKSVLSVVSDTTNNRFFAVIWGL